MNYSISPMGNPEGKAQGILSYIQTLVKIQIFSITTPALSFLEINIGRVDSPYCSNSWAIQKILLSRNIGE